MENIGIIILVLLLFNIPTIIGLIRSITDRGTSGDPIVITNSQTTSATGPAPTVALMKKDTTSNSPAPVKEAVSVMPALSASGDFEIKEGVLLRYHGREAHVRVPYGVIRIGKEAFMRTVSRTRYYEALPPMLAEWSGREGEMIEETYEETEGLDFIREVDLPESVEEIDQHAFYQCKNLERIRLSGKLRVIGRGAFQSCRSLNHIELPETLQVIGDHAFAYCANMKHIQLPQSLHSIDMGTFESCSSLECIQLPENLRDIGNYAFSDCQSLKNIQLPETLQVIAQGTFSGCENLAGIRLPESIREISYSAFWGCGKLEHIQLPENLRLIRKGAFKGCGSLKRLEVPADTTIEDGAYDANRTEIVRIPKEIA